MPVGAAIGAAGIGSAVIGSSAAKSAAKTQSQAAMQAGQAQLEASNRAADLQLQMFNTIRGDLSPYRQIGSSALPGISALLGLPTASGATGAGTPQTMISPGAFTAGGLAGAAPAAASPYAQYVQNNQDLNDFWAANQGKPGAFNAWGLPDNATIDQFGQAHWASNGQGESRSYTPMTAQQAMTGSQPAGAAAQPALSNTGISDYLSNLPGYQFAKDQGVQAVTSSLNARGLGGLSGSLGKGIARFVTGLADQTYGEQLDRLMKTAGIGQNAAAQTGTAGTQAASGAAGSLVGGSQAYGQGLIGAANASAGGTVGAANAIGAGLNSAANGYLTSRVLGMYGGAPTAAAVPNVPLSGLY